MMATELATMVVAELAAVAVELAAMMAELAAMMAELATMRQRACHDGSRSLSRWQQKA